MSLVTVGVLIIISIAGITPPSSRTVIRCTMIALRVPTICFRTCSRSSDGKKSSTREIDCGASIVCRVDITKCPVSDALIAARKLVASRISPIIITSGS